VADAQCSSRTCGVVAARGVVHAPRRFAYAAGAALVSRALWHGQRIDGKGSDILVLGEGNRDVDCVGRVILVLLRTRRAVAFWGGQGDGLKGMIIEWLKIG
jgi:hypothetical protein